MVRGAEHDEESAVLLANPETSFLAPRGRGRLWLGLADPSDFFATCQEILGTLHVLRRLARSFVNLDTGQGVLGTIKSAGDQDPAVF